MKFNKKSIYKFKKLDTFIAIIIIIGILGVLNFFSYQIFYRWDITQNKDYSISKASKKAVEKLDDIVNIKVYFSTNLPIAYISLEQEVGDILDEYVNYSNGKIRVEFIDPEKLDDPEQELYILGIPTLQFNVLEKDKYQVVKGYLGMVVQYGGKNEAIPVIQDTKNLEYQVTMSIKKVVSDEIASVGFLASNGCADTENVINSAYKKLQELYNVRILDLSSSEEIPFDINTLLIIGPNEDFSDEEFKALDLFIMRGGSLLILADGVKVEEGLVAVSNDINLFGFLENYGIKLNRNLVLDISSGIASFSSGFFTFSTNYPLWPKILKEGFDQNNAVVSQLESLILPWASSIEIIQNKINNDNTISYLAKSTDKSWVQKESYDLNPQQTFMPSGNVDQKILAVSVSGNFNSVYESDKIGQARIIAVGDSDFISDNFLRQAPDNLVFFQNLVDSLSLDEDLINIRSKGVSDRPIKELSDSSKIMIRYFNIFGVTIIVILFGIGRYFIRKKSRFTDGL